MDTTNDLEPSLDSERVWSVAELNDRIKRLLEGGIGQCWVRGEVSNLRRQASGHNYFSLKDSQGQIRAVLFRGDASRQETLPEDGAQIVVFGEVSVYGPQGSYQIIVRHVMLDGAGQLRLEFDRLKKKLADEGLFDENRKRRIPQMPEKIGIVTSPTGAALKDFISILQRRGWCGKLLVLPAKVQGDEAPDELIAALRAASELKDLDLLVIGRGGGSVEDLWAFNDEALVREVAAFPGPVISAVGHQIDFTLADFAADLRAETPSAAAEIVSHGFLESRERWRRCQDGFTEVMDRALETRSSEIRFLTEKLRAASPVSLVENLSLRVDDFSNRLANYLRSTSSQVRDRLETYERRFTLVDPANRLRLERTKLDALDKRLRSGSLESTLRRGFTLVSDPDGRPVSSIQGLQVGEEVKTRFVDGEVPMRVMDKGSSSEQTGSQ
ncbi:MAG: exodeoxyribonuclease VII large subunit [Opitutae bacterium]|nr:exodeoxyribonuclease VII large subunit [Opitutae bacterium]|tara:strand:- start:6155 stop:7477 length:1323 start_codon:yes stop_codon:yes gene_type:complete